MLQSTYSLDRPLSELLFRVLIIREWVDFTCCRHMRRSQSPAQSFCIQHTKLRCWEQPFCSRNSVQSAGCKVSTAIPWEQVKLDKAQRKRRKAGRLYYPTCIFTSQQLLMEKAMAPHSSTLAWKIPWMEEPGRLQSMGSLRVGHYSVTSLSLFTFMHWRRKWQPTPVFLPGESQGWRSLVSCHLWDCTESDSTEVTQQQQQVLMRFTSKNWALKKKNSF